MASAHYVFYTVFGVVGIILNLIIILAIKSDKSMRNPTYLFMAQLALSDVESFVPNLLGPGLAMITDQRPVILAKILAYSNAVGFHVGILWLVLVAMTRWAVFAKQEGMLEFFNMRNYTIICLLAWSFVHLWYSPFLFYDGAIMLVDGDMAGAYLYTNSTLSQIYRFWDESLNWGGLGLQVIFNTISFALVWQMRQKIMSPELRACHRHEVNLLIQCGLDGLIYAMIMIFGYYFVYSGDVSAWVMTGIDVFTLASHVDCAILYLCFNSKLRNIIINSFKKVFKRQVSKSVVVQINVNGVKANRV